MVLDHRGVWLLIAACCAAAVPLSVATSLRAELRAARRRPEAHRRLHLVATCAGAALTGIAVGMSVAFAALALAAVAKRLGW